MSVLLYTLSLLLLSRSVFGSATAAGCEATVTCPDYPGYEDYPTYDLATGDNTKWTFKYVYDPPCSYSESNREQVADSYS